MHSGWSLTQLAWRGVVLTASLLPETDQCSLAASCVMLSAYMRLALQAVKLFHMAISPT